MGRIEVAEPIQHVAPVRQQTVLQVPARIQQRRKMVATVTQVDPRRPGPIRQRRKTVTVGTQVDNHHPGSIQQRRETVTVGTQVDPQSPGPIRQRRETVTVGTQVDPPRLGPIATPPEIWCICREPEHGDMIFCENPGCLIEWLNCLHMDTAPENDWHCPNCSNIFNN